MSYPPPARGKNSFVFDLSTNPLAKRRASSAAGASPTPNSPTGTGSPNAFAAFSNTPDSTLGISPASRSVTSPPKSPFQFDSSELPPPPPCSTPSGARGFGFSSSEARNPEVTEVVEDLLYLGAETNVQNTPGPYSWLFNLPPGERVTVISVLSDHPKSQPFAGRHDYFEIRLDDSHTAASAPHFLSVIRVIEEARATRKKVLIHCQAGISRSATFILAYLMFKNFLRSGDVTYLTNLRSLQAKRACVSPNLNFSGQLLWFQNKLLEIGKNYPNGSIPITYVVHQLQEQGYQFVFDSVQTTVYFAHRGDNLHSLIINLTKNPH